MLITSYTLELPTRHSVRYVIVKGDWEPGDRSISKSWNFASRNEHDMRCNDGDPGLPDEKALFLSNKMR